jgi:hypothetical protein
MDEHKDLREMIANGKDRLEWTRKVANFDFYFVTEKFTCISRLQVDAGQVDMLRNLIQGDDYKEKLGGIVSQLYKLSFKTYHDIPRGPIKVANNKETKAGRRQVQGWRGSGT